MAWSRRRAVAAFFGLVLMIGAHPQDIAIAGIAFGLFAALCRVAVLLIARAKLNDADARLTTWNSLVSSTVIFCSRCARDHELA